MADLEFVHVPFGTEYPDMPEGVTDWERQEINGHWRNALHMYEDAAKRIAHAYSGLVQGKLPSPPACNDAQHLAQAIASSRALVVQVHSAEHRIAMAKLADAETTPSLTEKEG